MNCVTCGGFVKSGTRSGQCKACRTVECAEPGCERLILRRTTYKTYCGEHASKRKWKSTTAKYLEGL